VYAGEALVGSAPQDGFRLRELGEFELKGIAKPVKILEAVRGGTE
jgi:hypothetical protein